MTVKEYLESTFSDNPYNVRKRAKCKDGYEVSIQGGTNFHYCDPRELCNIYRNIELGFPSSLDDIIKPYAETPDTCDTVFGYVPINIAEKLIEKHGGIIRNNEC